MVVTWIYISWSALIFLTTLRFVHEQVTKVGLLILNFASSSYFETFGSRTFSLHLRHIKLLKLKNTFLKECMKLTRENYEIKDFSRRYYRKSEENMEKTKGDQKGPPRITYLSYLGPP